MTPAQDAKLRVAPKQVVLEFDKEIGTGLREVTLTSPTGKTTELDPKLDGPTATMQLPAKLGGGLWRVEWSALGPDGHPQRDSRTFTVPGAAPATASRAAFPVGAWKGAGYVGRAAFFLGVLVFVGGSAFAMFAARGFLPWGRSVACVAIVVGALVVVASHAAILHRLEVRDLLDPRHWWDAARLQASWGYVAAAALSLVALRLGSRELAPEAWRDRSGRQPVVLGLLLVAVAASPSISSHATVGGIAVLRLPLDMLHVLAASIWFGGLVQLLALTVPRRRTNPGIPDAVEVFSFFAFVAVIVLVVTGAFAAIVELDGSPSDLFGTPYGRLVVAKVLLLGLAAPLALRNRNRHVPAVISRGPGALPALRRFVAWELLIAVWIVLATAALVHEPPSRGGASGGAHAGHGM